MVLLIAIGTPLTVLSFRETASAPPVDSPSESATPPEGDPVTVDKAAQMTDDKEGAAGRIYYVDAVSGDDANDGLSEEKPLLSLRRVNQLSLNPGDRVLFRRGGVWNGQLRPEASGEEGKTIVFGMYGQTGDKPVLNGNGEVHATVELVNVSHVTVRNLEVTNYSGKTEEYRVGILLTARDKSLKGVTVSHCYVHHVDSHLWRNGNQDYHWFGGIAVKEELAVPLEDFSFTDLRIESNRVEQISGVGIGVNCNSKDTVIRGNIVNNVNCDGILLIGGETGLLERNITYTCGYADIGEAWVNTWLGMTKESVMQYNESYDNRASRDGQGYDIDNGSVNCIMQYNYSHDNTGGFLLVNCLFNNYGNTVRYNISQNDMLHLITWALPGEAEKTNFVNFYNNTFYTTRQLDKVCWFADYNKRLGTLGSFKNNIFYILGSSSATDWELAFLAYTFEGNCFYGDDLKEPDDPAKIKDNPLLLAPGTGGIGIGTVDGYKLQESSPCLNAGVVIEDNGGKDYWGNPVPADRKPHIGAYNGAGIAVAGGVNVAKGRVGTASSYNTGQFSNNIYYMNRLTDGKSSDVFSTQRVNESREEWVEIDLTSRYTVDTVVLKPAAGGACFPKNVRILAFDGQEYKEVANGKRLRGDKAATISFAPVEASGIRIVTDALQENGGVYCMELAEVEIYTAAP